MHLVGQSFILLFFVFPASASEPKVNYIEPREGSMAGGAMVFVHGRDFAPSQFSIDKPKIGNQIFFKSSLHSIECKIVPTDVSSVRVACEMGVSPIRTEAQYELYMLVSGKEVASYCGGNKCFFWYRNRATPTISKISPISCVPGTPIVITGLIVTAQFSRLSDGFDPTKKEITRIYAGSDVSDPFNPDTNELYGSHMDGSFGWFKSQPKSKAVASNDVYYIVSKMGNSKTSKDLFLIDGNKKLYLYQTHADIQSVSPLSGSLAGGTVVTIAGEGFGTRNEKVQVEIGGANCKIKEVTYNQITCITDPYNQTNILHPGNRGLLQEIWTTSPKSNLQDIEILTSSAPDYHSEVLSQSASPEVTSFNKTGGYSSKVSGFFVAPWNDDYTFYIKSDDKSKLFLSTTGRLEDKEEIASCPSATTKWDRFASQESRKFSLKKGQVVNVHALHTDFALEHSVSIGMSMEDVHHTNSKAGRAVDEKQSIVTSSVVLCEKQILDMNKWNESETIYEIQEVTVPMCIQQANTTTDCNNTFKLIYNGMPTTSLSPNSAEAQDLEQALNSLSSIRTNGHVNVSSTRSNNATVFTIQFTLSDANSVQLLSSSVSQENDTSFNVTIKRVRTGGTTSRGFQLSYGGAISKPIIPSQVTEESLQATLLEMFSAECTQSSSSAYFNNGFEKPIIGKEYGQRVTDEMPFCGRTSLKNPWFMWRTLNTEIRKGIPVRAYDVNQYQHVCFAYRGAIREYISVSFTYQLSSGASETRARWYPYSRKSVSTNWRHVCVNLRDKITGDSFITKRASANTKYKIEWIQFMKDVDATDEDFFIDEFCVGKVPVTVVSRKLPAMPSGYLIEKVTVEQLGPGRFSVCMLPAGCGFELPLLAVYTTVQFNSSNDPNNATYKFPGLYSSIHVQRVQNASPPITGTFDVTYEGKTVKDIPADVTGPKLKRLLEERFDVGELLVQRSGSCSSFTWTITWIDKGGNHPQLMVNSSLLGNQPSITSNTIDDGRFFLRPIPGEFLRTPNTAPQVVVRVNGITSSCLNNTCSFNYTVHQTPQVQSLSPNAGTAATQITLTGSGFSTTPSDNHVTIAGVQINVTASTTTTLTCLVGDCPGGVHPVQVHVTGKGNAVLQSSSTAFHYTIAIRSVSPDRGSTAGGLQIIIQGSGFSNDKSAVAVTLNGSSCDVIEASLSKIMCRTPAHSSAGHVSMKVTVSGASADKTNAFEYDAALTPTVVSLSPQKGGVKGGNVMTISGSGFGTSSDLTISIGDSLCKVIGVRDDQVRCTIPAHGPAMVNITMVIPGKGYPTLPWSFRFYEYVLRVDSISPWNGSIAGGSILTITGSGFSDNRTDNKITIGDKICTVTSSNTSYITCVTPDSSKTIKINNGGTHPEYGFGYAWSKKLVEIDLGDTVEWDWKGDPLSKLQYQVYQTSQDSSLYDGTGFKSSRSSDGSYKYRFLRAGTYYYSSGPVDDNGDIIMDGKVMVRALSSQEYQLRLSIAGFPADCHAVSQETSSSSCNTGITTTIPRCQPAPIKPPAPVSGQCISFTYKNCQTPIVTEIIPNTGTSQQVITIKGSGFSDKPCQNIVTLGKHGCNIVTSNESIITCRVDLNTRPKSGEKYDVKVTVKNRGRALFQTNGKAMTSFVLVPRVSNITPKSGSRGGGTTIFVTGDGFSEFNSGNSVLLGEAICKVTNATYTRLTCTVDPQPASAVGNQLLTVTVGEMKSNCTRANCQFSFLDSKTPRVDDMQSTKVTGPDHILRLYGSGFGTIKANLFVTVGSVTSCEVTEIFDDKIKCRIAYASAGRHVIQVLHDNHGLAIFKEGFNKTITVTASISGLKPLDSSTEGGLRLQINGFGFNSTTNGETSVTINNKQATVLSVTFTQIMVVTPPNPPGNAQISIRSGETVFPTSQIIYSDAATPEIASITPTTARAGQLVTLLGNFPSSTPSSSHVKIGDTSCTTSYATVSQIKCTVPPLPAGSYSVSLVIDNKGKARSSATLIIDLVMTFLSPSECGHGGGRIVVVKGSGFSHSTTIKICGNVCGHSQDTPINNTNIRCEVPPSSKESRGADQACAVEVSAGGITKRLSNGFTYRDSMTSEVTSVSPERGGTGGGMTLTIKGRGFSSTQGDNIVTIDGTACSVKSANVNQIQCITGSHNSTIKTKVNVDVGNNGKAIHDNADFYYVDVWSSRFSWGGKPPPAKDDFVVIKKGQTMLLDTDTPVLKMLLIQGGQLVFDDTKDIHLQSQHIMITDGGAFQVGTEENPFLREATITMHGHTRSKEIPVFGAKNIGLREGTLDLHGKHVPITWTKLSSTAAKGDNQIHLIDQVTWEVGNEIVIASTSRSQRENEKLKITRILNAGKTLEIKPALQYQHISIQQTIANRDIETRAEVGLLTRNVVIQGSIHGEWTEDIEACPKDFKPGQFQTQTCFQGTFGDDVGSDQYGVQIMIHAREKDKDLVTARFSHIEIRHAGQAFRMGRYPIHFHISGSVAGSFVKGCAIHRSFNRAITMHGVHDLIVERNVVYDIMGNALFMEDGIETGNVVQYNLGIFVKASSSSLNVDITPATFWVTNANNTVSHNAAAGGSHFGFWYQMFKHPDGPSFTPDVCPRSVPMKEFQNNTAHSFGRYGLWVFPVYHPMEGGGCNAQLAKPAYFNSLTCWNNKRGVEVVDGGAVRINDSVMLDNEVAGIEVVMAETHDSPWGGAMIQDTLIVSHSQLNPSPNILYMESGVRTPQTHGLVLSGVTFVNFDQPNCASAAIQCCAQCAEFKKRGGYETRFEKTNFINSPCRTRFQWRHQTVLRDLDGSLTGHSGGGFLVPTNGNLPPNNCQISAKDSHGAVTGSVCDNKMDFRRFAMNNALPTYLQGKDIELENKYGTDEIPFNFKDHTHPNGWVGTVLVGTEYNLTFIDAPQLTNISYSASVFEPHPTDRIIINHKLKQIPDHFSTTGRYQNMTKTLPTAGDGHGAWAFNNDTKVFTYQFSGLGNTQTLNKNYPRKNVNPRVYRCFYLDCIVPTPPPPPKGRPLEYQKWSNPDAWEDTEPQYGGYGGILPKDGEDVMITSNMWMVVDIQPASINKLYVEGALEIDGPDGIVLNATYILVTGSIVVGWPDKPYPKNFLLSLRGSWSAEDNPMSNAPNTGTKSLAVFGNMYFHGQPREIYWTKMNSTALPGSNVITVRDAVDWKTGDEIVISSTTKEPRQAEVHQIISVSQDRRTLVLNGSLHYKHKSVTNNAGRWTYTLAAEVGLLSRNIKIVGADEPAGSLGKQSFGCRVLISTVNSGGAFRKANARIENVEFKNCGQEGWTDSYDPRYALALVSLGDVEGNSSYIRGNSFHHGFNTAIGMFGTNNLIVQDNVIYFTLGSCIIDQGKGNSMIHNLAVLSVSIATYKGRQEVAILWPGAIEIQAAVNPYMCNNTVAGSERIGYLLDGEACTASQNGWYGNEVHGAWHGIHLAYFEGLSQCSKIAHFLIWGNLDYGIFTHPMSSIVLSNIMLIDNPTSLLPHIWRPHALSHETADKFLTLTDSLIVGTSPGYDCSDSSITPYARRPYPEIGEMVKMAPEGGRIGVALTFFGSGKSNGPTMPWEGPHDYPAINGLTKYIRVTCANFEVSCGKRDVCIISNQWIGDIMHPVHVSEMFKESVDMESLLFLVKPSTKWINPSDCVDMDCDGRRQIVIKDLDGTLTGLGVGTTIIPKAEYEWNGNKRYGLGDYRIPKTALTAVDGSRLDVTTLFPHKGIVRGTRKQTTCSWKTPWNAYQCTGLDHLMLVIESLDADTETRRLSPVSLSADGYVNLLNGPMDHGWCLGYTCQERISTFYGIVAANKNYSLYFSSNEPQNLRFHLLNSDDTQVIRLAIYFQRPQRKDVYRKGTYMYPTNADIENGEFKFKPTPHGVPKDYYEPPLASRSGSNYFNNEESTLYVVVRGSEPVDIHTTPVVVITIAARKVPVDEFFKKNVVENLAFLLGCDPSLIRFMDVISASGSSRRRRAVDDTMQIVVEIGNNPAPTVPYTSATNNTNATGSTPTASHNTTGVYNTSFEQLQQMADQVVEAAQTGALSQNVDGLQVTGLSVLEPVPPPVDPTGGVRASNLTGGSANVTNGTLTYDQRMAQAQADVTQPVVFLIPCKLVLVQQPYGANETVPFISQPKLKIVDCFDQLVTGLGHGALVNWTVTASIRPGTGDTNARVNGTNTIEIIDGWANFTDLSISHNGSDYVLEFNITKPQTAKFNTSSNSFEVKERQFYFILTHQPADANETVPFGQQPGIEVRDVANAQIVSNTGWKGRKWYLTAVKGQTNLQANLNGSTTVEFVNGIARFKNLTLDIAGTGYTLNLTVKTIPESRYSYFIQSDPFDVKERPMLLVLVQQPGNCNDTVICGSQPAIEIRSRYPDSLVQNIGWKNRQWFIDVTHVQGMAGSPMNATTELPVTTVGRVQMNDLWFYEVSSSHKLKFTVRTEPQSSYTNMSVSSEVFDVETRQFNLHISTQPDDCNQTVPCGSQPVVEVFDAGTNKLGIPLKGSWYIAASLKSSHLNGSLGGTFNVTVDNGKATFADLSVSIFGAGYVLDFESNYGHQVSSSAFEVQYVNDFAPEFHPPSGLYSISLSEDSSLGRYITTVAATDKDSGPQGEVFYAIIGGNVGNAFAINSTNGVVLTNSLLDRETIAKYDLIIKAYDGAVAGKEKYTNGKVLLNITDVNDNTPTFSSVPDPVLAREDLHISDVIIRIQASDPDAGTNSELHYTIDSGNDHGLFVIDESTGDLKVNGSLDLEQSQLPNINHTILIQVTDLGTPTPRNNTIQVNITIVPVNEFTPQLLHASSYNFSFVENVSPGIGGVYVLDVNATDDDYGEHGHVTYSIISGNGEGKFILDSTSGILLLNSTLDYETAPSYNIIIHAHDANTAGITRTVAFTVHITVIDVNDNTPTFSQPQFSIQVEEDSPLGFVATILNAVDPDGGVNGLVTYSIIWTNASDAWAINGSTGALTLNASLDLDSPCKSEMIHSVIVKAEDSGIPFTLRSNTTLTIRIVYKNEYSPVFPTNIETKLIPENVAIGTVIYQVTAADADCGPDGQVEYSITSGNTGRVFTIERTSGNLSTDARLDRETLGSYSLNIQANDKGGSHSASMSLMISLSDINDNKPTFSQMSFHQQIPENASINTQVADVRAKDLDNGLNGQLTYSITSGNERGYFIIEQGIIKVIKNLDIESQNHSSDYTYRLNVFVTDKGTSALNNSVTVTVLIKQVNEYAPVVVGGNGYVEVSEDSAIGLIVYDVNGTDADYGPDGLITYTFLSGNERGEFSIDSSTGIVTLNKQLDYESRTVHHLQIALTDKAPRPGDRRSTVAQLIITVLDVNDTVPYQIEARMIQPYITSSSDIASWAGIHTKSLLEIFLVHENGTREDITQQTSRVTFDWTSESNNLFSVETINGMPTVIGNSAGRTGSGNLLLQVVDVKRFKLNVTVVGFRGIKMSVLPYPEIPSSPEVTMIRQILPGIFQKVIVKTIMDITGNMKKDVSLSPNTTISVINSVQVNNSYTLGPVPVNLLTFTGNDYDGQLILKAKFASESSDVVNITVSSQVMYITSIDKFGYLNLNQTFDDFPGITRHPFAELRTEGGTTFRVENFTQYNGLLRFTISSTDAVSLDATSGVLTLRSHDNRPIVIQASSTVNESVSASFSIYSNPKPLSGEVDIGASVGPAIPTLSVDQTWKMPVRVNPGSKGLLAIDVQLRFDVNALQVINTEATLFYDVTGNTVRIFSLVHDSHSTHVANITFKALTSGIPSVTVESFDSVDMSLHVTPARQSGPCSQAVTGDVNKDCLFDILDVAFIQRYYLSAGTGFNDEFGLMMKGVTSSQRSQMDVDWSTHINVDDARLLAKVVLGKAKLISEMSVLIPNHNRNDKSPCEMDIKIKLVEKDGRVVDGSRTDVYVDIAHTTSTVHTQVDETQLDTGIKAALKDNHTFYGGVYKAVFDTRSSIFRVFSKNSKLSAKNIGLTVVQVLRDESGNVKFVTPMFGSSSYNAYPPGLDIILIRDVRLRIDGGYHPQRMVDFEETTERCNDPYVTRTIEVKFIGKFNDVIQGDKPPLMNKIEAELSRLHPEAQFKVLSLDEGSIIATMNLTVTQSKEKSTVKALYSNVVNGIAITHNGHIIVTLPQMKVDGDDYRVSEQADTSSGLSTTHIVIVVIIVLLILFVLIGLVVYRFWREKKRKTVPSPPTTPDNCWTNDEGGEIIKESYFKKRGTIYVVNEDNGGYNDENGSQPFKKTASDGYDQSIESFDAESVQTIAPLASTPRVRRAFTKNPIREKLPDSSSSAKTCQTSIPDPPVIVVERQQDNTSEQTQTTKDNDEHRVAPAYEMLYGSPEDQSVGSFSPPPSASSRTPSPSVEVLPNQILSAEEMEAATPSLMPSDAEEATGHPVLRKEHPVSLIRANVEMGNLAHFVGVVNANVLGTLEELRADMKAILPRHLTTKRYVFVSRRLETIEPWREAHMFVKQAFMKSIRIKILYGTDRCEDFCPCGKVARTWCDDCEVQGYCSEECRESDSINHVTNCKGDKTKQKLALRDERLTTGNV